jgi:voltage-gated sodium channel
MGLFVSQTVFVAEILARWTAAPAGEFFCDSWNRFDFVIVSLSLTPAIGEFALVARVFQVLRVLRVLSVSQALWGSVLRQDGGAGSLVIAVCLVLLSGYVFALAGFHLFGGALPEWSSLAQSVLSLARSMSPGGLATALSSRGTLLAFHIVFYLTMLAIAVNLTASVLCTSRARLP